MKSFLELKEKIQKGKDDPCWKDYVQLGTKKKNGKEVPNCVPKESTIQEESAELDETITPKHVKMAIGVASDKRYAGGNMTGAVNAIEKIKKGLSDHPQVKAVLRRQNESLDEVKIPANYAQQMAAKKKRDAKIAKQDKFGKADAEYYKKHLQNESLDEAGSPERLAIIKRATQRVKDKKNAARAADKKASFKAAVRDMQTRGAQRGMAPLKRDLDEGRNDARKALMGLAKRGGIDKATFQKAYDLYSDTKFVELKKLISGADTDPREAILDVINRHDSRAFNSMYPRGLSKGGLTKESTDLGEKSRSFPFQGSNDHAPKNIFQPPFGSRKNMGQVTFLDKSGKEYSPTSSKNKKKVKENEELGEAFKKGDSVTVKNARKYDALSKPEVSGTVIGMNGNKVMVKVGSGQMNVDARDLMKESVELDEAEGTGVKKFVRGMRVQNLNGSKGTVIKGGDNMKKAVEVEWDNGQTTLASAKYLKSIKKNESVELGEAKISVGDRVTLQPNKNTLDRSLIGKAGVVTGVVGSKPTVKFANGKTIAVSPNDLKINESVELDEATYMVTIDKGTYGGVKSDGQPILVKAKSVRDATTRAATKVKINPKLVPTGGFNVKVNNKESSEHENCGTPDCCGTCDTDIKEMNFFKFRNRLDSTRD